MLTFFDKATGKIEALKKGYINSLIYCILFCLVITAYAIHDIRSRYHDEVSDVSSRVANTSFLISEWLKGEYRTSDYVLQDIISQLSLDDLHYPPRNISEHTKITEFLKSKLATLPEHFKGIGTSDKDCIIVHTYNKPPRKSIIGFDGGQRDWCTAYNNEATEQYITPAFLGNTDDLVIIQNRAFRSDSNEFYGMVGLSMELDFFSELIDQVSIGDHGVIAISDVNLSLLARKPALPEALGKKVDDAIAEDFLASDEHYKAYSNQSPLDGEPRFYAVRKVDDLPFIIVVGEAEQDWLKDWQTRTWLTIVTLILLCGMAIVILRNHWKELHQRDKLLHQSQTDPLTKVLNRRGFMEKAEKELKRVQRYQSDLAVLILDIDLFKLINDGHGHATGDRALIAFTRACLDTLRDIDVLGRIGGDEFTILLPNTSSEEAVIVAERIRLAIETCEVLDDDNVPVAMTSSIGVTMVRPEITNISEALQLADEVLYISKEKGRNRVEFSLGRR